MKHTHHDKPSGFSLVETVIAIGVLAVMLTGFMIVFAPAAAGIRKSINSQDAIRLVNTLEQELVTLRGAESVAYSTGFHKAFTFIKDSNGSGANPDNAVLVYKYRASLTATRPGDGTPEPVTSAAGKLPGVDYAVQCMMRRKGDPEFFADLPATEGPVYLVKCTQLILGDSDKLELATAGQIANASTPTVAVADVDNYAHGVITFVADFYDLPSKGVGFFTSQFGNFYQNAQKPMFSRSLGVRR
ncbi:MAG TPA: type II secretion system protein [Luteolibacter sp.]|nr:type II secretion system protein [Luteolibacter sp.]